MDTATQELIYQGITIGLSFILGLIGLAVKGWIADNVDASRYGFENDRVERILDNAIFKAEQYAKEYAKEQATKLSGNNKLSHAREYINKVDPTLIAKYGDQLDNMISRKVAQKFGV